MSAQLDLFDADALDVLAALGALDLAAGDRALADEIAQLAALPRAARCRCDRPWPDGGRCVKCGREWL